MIKFNAQLVTLDASADPATPSRTITGLAVPWDVVANLSGDTGPVKFLKDSISVDGPMPKLLEFHDDTRVIGRVIERVSSSEGLLFTAKLSATRAADDAMALLADGSISAVSVGAIPIKFKRVDGVMEVSEARMIELSLVSFPAYADAEIQSVYASSEEPEEIPEEPTPPQPSEEDAMSEQTIVEAALATQPLYAQPRKEPRIPNSWEYMAAMHAGGDTWINAQKVFKDYTDFHASPLKAAAGDEFLVSVPGLLTQVTMGPVFQDINFMRPVVAALGARAMPQTPASTFNRPTITTHQATATAQTEGSAVATATGVIANNTVTKKTFANSANISYQTLDFTDPAALQIVISDLIGGYMVGTDNEAADNLLTAATSAGVWDLTIADLYKSIYDSAVVTLAATNMLPTHMFVDPATYALIMQLADTTGRTIFANLNGGLSGMNAMGTGNATSLSVDANRNDNGPLGLKLVVDNNFATKTMIIMKDIGFEIFEDWRGILSIDAPATLTRTVSTHGYFCTFKANAAMIQKITQA